MHSRFRVTNSSDRLGLDLGLPQVYRVPTASQGSQGEKALQEKKGQEELRIYVEPKLHCRKLLPSQEESEREVTDGSWVRVEPHQFTLSATPITHELLAFEEKQRAREAARKAEQLEAVTVPADLPEPAVGRAGVGVKGGGQANGGERRKTLGQGKGLKHSSRSEASETTPRSSKKKSTGGPLSVARPDAITRPPARAPALPPALPRALPQLPTTPIPKGELPPMSIRSPPLLSGPPNPLLSSLTPLPPSKTYAKPSTTPVSTSAAAPQSQLISIQVPMAGPDGTQTLQTINVPRSVLAGASDRPILLTVTPKNGINKGQKQIVVLTKNTATGSTTAGLARPPGSPQIQGSQVIPQQQLGNTEIQRGSIQPGGVQQHTGSPQQEAKSVHLSPRPAAVSASLGGTQSPSIPQLVVRQAVSSPSRPALVAHGAQQVTSGVRQVSQQGIQQTSQVAKSIQNTFQGGQQILSGVQSRVLPQTPKVVKSISSPAVRAPFPATAAALAPQAAPPVRAAGTPRASSPQVLRGQLIQTPQGQMLVQGDRRILLGPNSVVQGGKLVLTAAQMAALTGATPPRQTVLQGPQQPQATVIRQQIVRQKPTVHQAQTPVSGTPASNPLLQGMVSSQPQNSPTSQSRSLPVMQSPGTPGANTQPTRLILGGNQHAASNGAVTSVASSPLASTGTPAGDPPASEANASVSRILAALHNRGLVSQQNGKFYYVGGGDQRKQQAVPVTGGGQSQVKGQPSAVVIPGAGLNMDSITASPHMVRMASSLLLGGNQGGAVGTGSSSATAINGSSLPSSPSKLPHVPGSPLVQQGAAISNPGSSHPALPASPLAALGGGKQSFYYRDPALPNGWYIRVDRTQIAEHRYQVETFFFSPDGALLRSQSDVAGYLGGRLQVNDKSHRPPVSVARLPWKDDLIDTNKLFVPNLENLANIVGTAGSNLTRKRPGEGGGAGEEKRNCPEPLPLFPL